MTKEYDREYCRKHKGLRNHRDALRRASGKGEIPPWFSEGPVLALYEYAQALQESTGDLYQVDHIHPLKHFRVCGLHCLSNLQVIPAKQNKRKKNRFRYDLTGHWPHCDL